MILLLGLRGWKRMNRDEKAANIESAHTKAANIVCFLAILFGECTQVVIDTLMGFHPDYLVEKFDRFIESEGIEYMWGMHASLRREVFEPYVNKWKLGLCK